MSVSQESRADHYFITDMCIECGICFDSCSSNAIEEGSPYRIDPESCIGCRLCVEVCPACAIEKAEQS